MRTEAEHDLLQDVFDEMQSLKKALASQDERRVDIKEFAFPKYLLIP